MIGPATQRYLSTSDARGAIHAFVEFARTKDIQLVANGGLFPVELTVAETSALIDQQQGIDRAQLNAERASQLQPGAECACGE
jgi:hypothetical protein